MDPTNIGNVIAQVNDPNAPQWVEGLKWVFAALLLSFAFVGPIILGPLIERFKHKTPATDPVVKQSTLDTKTMALVGGALADSASIMALVGALHRLSDILEDRLKLEQQEGEENKLKRTVREMLQDLDRLENPNDEPRSRRKT